MRKHAVIWIDHKEARILHVHPDRVVEATVSAPRRLAHEHLEGPEGAKEHPANAARFFQDVARSIDEGEGILVVGPSTAKLEFLRYLHKNEHALEVRIVGVETVDHPTDGQIIDYARKYFKPSDRMP